MRAALPLLPLLFARLIDGERHGANAEAINRGLHLAFEPLAPETGPQ